MNRLNLTILMPCLNEEKTVGECVISAKKFFDKFSLIGEVLVCDNGSDDNSVVIAKRAGARVISVKDKGYGNAIIKGINNARYKYIIMGDADGSYDFSQIDNIYEQLLKGYDVVIGNRFKGTMEKGAMPFLHKYIGNPILSLIGKSIYHTNVNDWHCGLRGFSSSSIKSLDLHSTGMEFASEMILKAKKNGLNMKEVPVNYYRDKRNGKSHLRSIPDGMRHLKMLWDNK